LRSIRSVLLTALLLGSVAGCADNSDFFWYPPQVRGNKVDSDSLAQLIPGTSTKQDVNALLGSPTAKGSFDDNTWIYISQVTRPQIAATQGVEDQRVVVATFNDKGILSKVEKRSQDDALPVDVVARATPSPGTEASWLQQLLGNVGKFTAAAPDSKQGSQGTSTNPGNF
jgi:outer membrane protein assembly factor BamE (lipoprotein component of BamABCDE complex)